MTMGHAFNKKSCIVPLFYRINTNNHKTVPLYCYAIYLRN